MGTVTDKMTERKNAAANRDAVRKQLYLNEREYRASKAIDAWSKIARIGAGLKSLPLKEQQNVAFNLSQQATYMSKLNEAQLSQSFSQFAPENMLRLVRLSMPGVCRNKVFTEFAMESAKDSIKYIKPVIDKTQGGFDTNDKHTLYGREDDPFGYDNGSGDLVNTANVGDYDADYRKALYETQEDRLTGELTNYPHGSASGKVVTFDFTKVDNGDEIKLLKWTTKGGKTGDKLLRGYTVVYGDNETDLVAMENKRVPGTFLVGHKYEGAKVSYKDATETTAGNELVVDFTNAKSMPSKVSAYARVDLEDDFEGTALGEVQLIMTDHDFKPRPTMVGVTWSQMAEIVLDASFGVSAQELLLQYAAESIRVNLDYRAFKLAYFAAKTNSDAHYVEFDAGYNSSKDVTTKEGYIHNAQTFGSAIDTLSDNMLNEINRGGVSRLVAGPSAGSYLKLNGAFNTRGKQANIGIHQIGEFDGIPTFKAPSQIIPSDEILTVWKNDENEGDVAIAFGTLIPFVNSGVIQRKQMYKEAGIASYGDWSLLNKRYLGIIRIKNMKDVTADLKNVKTQTSDSTVVLDNGNADPETPETPDTPATGD